MLTQFLVFVEGGRNYYAKTLAEECKYKVKRRALKRQKIWLILVLADGDKGSDYGFHCET